MTGPFLTASNRTSSSTLAADSALLQRAIQCFTRTLQFSSLYFFKPPHPIDFYSFAKNSIRFHRNY